MCIQRGKCCSLAVWFLRAELLVSSGSVDGARCRALRWSLRTARCFPALRTEPGPCARCSSSCCCLQRFPLWCVEYWQKGSRTVRNRTSNLNRGGCQSCLGHLAWCMPVEGLLASTPTGSRYFGNCLLQSLSFSQYEIVLHFNCIAKSRKS